MIPAEYFWFALMFMLGIIGAVRGLAKELGATAILALCLFVLKFVWKQFSPTVTALADGSAGLTEPMLKAIIFSVAILFVAFISYEGIVLHFPFKDLKGLGKGLFGFLGGLLNGYMVIGTIWDVVAHASYFSPKVSIVSQSLTPLHETIVQILPVTFINQYLLLAIGMILLLAIVIR